MGHIKNYEALSKFVTSYAEKTVDFFYGHSVQRKYIRPGRPQKTTSAGQPSKLQ